MLTPSMKNSTPVISFSASVASAVIVLVPGSTACMSVGAVILTSGRVVADRPLPLASQKFIRKFTVPVKTTYSDIVSVLSGTSMVTSAQRLGPPVFGTWPVPRTSPVGEFSRSSMPPPACDEATRNESESMPVKLTGS